MLIKSEHSIRLRPRGSAIKLEEFQSLANRTPPTSAARRSTSAPPHNLEYADQTFRKEPIKDRTTRLFTEIADRRNRVTGPDYGTDKGVCYLHLVFSMSEEELKASALPNLTEAATQFVQQMERDMQSVWDSDSGGAMPCKIRTKGEAELRREEYRMLSNQMPLDRHETASAIAYPATEAHVVLFVRLAALKRWKVRLVSGGHSAGLHSFYQKKDPSRMKKKKGNGLVMSFLNMRSIVVAEWRPDNKTGGNASIRVLKMQPGAIWCEAYAAAEETNAFLAGGSCATVGVGGFYLGGGFGYLMGLLGFGVDNVKAFRAVTASGHLLENIDNTVNKDLFDALRGGGQAGLAVVTELTVKLHERGQFGCLFKLDLWYSARPERASTYLVEMAKKDPTRLHIRARWQAMPSHDAGPMHLAFRVALHFLSRADDEDLAPGDRASTRDKVASYLRDVDADLPLGCEGLDWPTCVQKAWLNCPSHGYIDIDGVPMPDWGDTLEMTMPSTTAEQANEWGEKALPWIQLMTEKNLPHQESLYTDGYQHRTSLKSVLIRDLVLPVKFWETSEQLIREASETAGLTAYISVLSWGQGRGRHSDEDAVAETHSAYSWLVIISMDFALRHPDKVLRYESRTGSLLLVPGKDFDEAALDWTQRATKAIVRATLEAEEGREWEQLSPYPNLYDQMISPQRDDLDAVARMYGNKFQTVLNAKVRWDREHHIASHFDHLDEWSSCGHPDISDILIDPPLCRCPGAESICRDVQLDIGSLKAVWLKDGHAEHAAAITDCIARGISSIPRVAAMTTESSQSARRRPLSARATICKEFGSLDKNSLQSVREDKIKTWFENRPAEGGVNASRGHIAGVEANGQLVAVVGLRMLDRTSPSHKYWEVLRSQPGINVAEVGLMHVDEQCQGMALSRIVMEAILQKAIAENVGELVGESTPNAYWMFVDKYGFWSKDGKNEHGPTLISMYPVKIP